MMLERISIAAPCSADWDSMHGTDRVRNCGQCNKNVYNLSAMTRRQAEALLRETEGRLCTRFYRRPDGTILTENCPVGLKAIGRRISRVAGAAMSALATISSAAAQFPFSPAPVELRKISSSISGVVQDASGAVIPGAVIEITSRATGAKTVGRADVAGRFQMESLASGKYDIQVRASGFEEMRREITLSTGVKFKLTATLQVPVTLGETITIPEDVFYRMPYRDKLDLIKIPIK